MNEKQLVLSAVYLVGAGELLLSAFFWRTHSKNAIRKVMALVALSTAIWVITSGLSSYTVQTPLTMLWMRLVLISGIFIVTTILHFSIIYPFPILEMDIFRKLAIYFPALFFSIVAITSNTILIGFSGSDTNPGVVFRGPLYNFYNLVTLVLYIASLIVLFVRQKSQGGVIKRNSLYIVWSILLGGIPAVFINLIVPLFVDNFPINPNVGAISTVFWLGITTYIVVKK